MKSLKDNFFVNIARGCMIFWYVCFPLVIIGKLIQFIFYPALDSQQANTLLPNVDLLGLFGNEKFVMQLNFSSVVLWLFVLVVNVGLIAGIFYAIIILNKFLKNVYNDRPFIRENGKHLKVIGVLVIGLSTLAYIVKGIDGNLIKHSGVFLYIFATFINLLFRTDWVMGLIIFVIGEVIVRAAEMKEEQDLTV